jgi:serine/threonine-protein kinase RsbW
VNARFSLHIQAEPKELEKIRRFVEETATALCVDREAIPGAVLAVDEAACNIMTHGYRGRQGTIEIEMERDGDALVIRLRDEAAPFDPTSVPPPDLTLPLERRPPGGMGIYLIRQVMDEMTHRIRPRGGNELTLVKRGIGAREE